MLSHWNKTSATFNTNRNAQRTYTVRGLVVVEMVLAEGTQLNITRRSILMAVECHMITTVCMTGVLTTCTEEMRRGDITTKIL